jgi:site-specific DNA recombinase
MTNNERNDNYSEQHKAKLLELYGKYRGLRAFLLTRVSSGSQSHEAQERVIRDLLIELIGLRLDEEQHIVHSTYTGLEYRYHQALDDVLRMAERHEFDVLCIDVLDRGLGRKGVAREIFRGQLREFGVHILSTEPDDHSDDDSLEGTYMRLMQGYKAEKEVSDFVRRTRNAKRDKALGNPAKGIPPKVVGNGERPYGYKYVRDAKGKIETLELNYDVVWEDSKGVKWTEVRVMVFIFQCAKRRIPIRQIAKRLNDIGIPAPFISLGKKYTSSGVQAEKLLWQLSTISKMLRNTTYSGRHVVNKYRTEKVPGKKSRRHIKNPPEEWIIVPVPALVSIELQEEVMKNLQLNQRFAPRNNKQEEPGLLRSGLARCGHCGRTASPRTDGQGHIYYQCLTVSSLHKCRGCTIPAFSVDEAAWEVVVNIISNPAQVDKAWEKQKSKDPTAKRREEIDRQLAENRARQRNLRANHMKESEEREFDRKTLEDYNLRMRQLRHEEQQLESERIDDEKMKREWEAVQQKLESLHKKCAVMREKLKNPKYVPNYKDKRDMIEFLGITAILWESGHINPETSKLERIRIQARFTNIVMPFSSGWKHNVPLLEWVY